MTPLTKQYNDYFKVPAPEEDRYVAPEGRYHYHTPPTLDTTYVIREPVQVPITPNLRYHPQPHPPYDSLKLAGYYRGMRSQTSHTGGATALLGYNQWTYANGNGNVYGGQRNDIDDDFEVQVSAGIFHSKGLI